MFIFFLRQFLAFLWLSDENHFFSYFWPKCCKIEKLKIFQKYELSQTSTMLQNIPSKNITIQENILFLSNFLIVVTRNAVCAPNRHKNTVKDWWKFKIIEKIIKILIFSRKKCNILKYADLLGINQVWEVYLSIIFSIVDMLYVMVEAHILMKKVTNKKKFFFRENVAFRTSKDCTFSQGLVSLQKWCLKKKKT